MQLVTSMVEWTDVTECVCAVCVRCVPLSCW